MRSSRSVAFATTALLLACSSPTDSARQGLVGDWGSGPIELSPTSWYEHRLSFSASGTYTWEIRNYGAHSGQSRDELSAYHRTTGAFRADCNRLVLEPMRVASWDALFGPDSPERVDENPANVHPDDIRFDAGPWLLLLRYASYPADAAVPTTMALVREF